MDIIGAPKGPKVDAKITTGFAGYHVVKGPNEELAVELVKYLTSKEISTKLVSTFRLPDVLSLILMNSLTNQKVFPALKA